MPFKRSTWKCIVRGCTGEAELSYTVVISTPGNRKERLQRWSTAQRLCREHGNELAAGVMPTAVIAAVGDAVKAARGER